MRYLLSTAVVLLAASAGIAEVPAQKPNVVFVLTDDQRWDCLGVAGHGCVLRFGQSCCDQPASGVPSGRCAAGAAMRSIARRCQRLPAGNAAHRRAAAPLAST